MEDKDKQSNPGETLVRIKNSQGEVIKEFDPTDPIQRAQLEEWGSTLSQLTGRHAQEKDQLAKELDGLRHYRVLAEQQDSDELIAQVRKLREDGEHDKADELLKAYTANEISRKEGEMEFELLWRDYKYQRKELFDSFDPLDEQAYKLSIRQNYLADLAKSENQFKVLDGLFKKKLEKLTSQEQIPQAGLERKSQGSFIPKAESPEEKKSETDVWRKHMEELGYKKF